MFGKIRASPLIIRLCSAPQTGIFEKTIFGKTYKIGAALVVKNITVVGAAVSFGLALRVCAGSATCIDTELLSSLAFGSSDPKLLCCLDKALLCPSEVSMCGASTPGQKDTSSAATMTSQFALMSVLLLAAMMM